MAVRTEEAVGPLPHLRSNIRRPPIADYHLVETSVWTVLRQRLHRRLADHPPNPFRPTALRW